MGPPWTRTGSRLSPPDVGEPCPGRLSAHPTRLRLREVSGVAVPGGYGRREGRVRLGAQPPRALRQGPHHARRVQRRSDHRARVEHRPRGRGEIKGASGRAAPRGESGSRRPIVLLALVDVCAPHQSRVRGVPRGDMGGLTLAGDHPARIEIEAGLPPPALVLEDHHEGAPVLARPPLEAHPGRGAGAEGGAHPTARRLTRAGGGRQRIVADHRAHHGGV